MGDLVPEGLIKLIGAVVALEINTRLTKADDIIEKAMGKADDHRLAAALRTAEAHRRVEAGEAGDIKWSKWWKSNIDRSAGEVSKLLKVGQSDNPRQALKDFRSAKCVADRKQRAENKAEKVSRAGNICDDTLSALATMDLAGAKKFVEQACEIVNERLEKEDPLFIPPWLRRSA